MCEQTDGPGGTITGSSEPYMPGHNAYTGMTHEIEEEPEVVRLVPPLFRRTPPSTDTT
jgi:hypothetical protein